MVLWLFFEFMSINKINVPLPLTPTHTKCIVILCKVQKIQI